MSARSPHRIEYHLLIGVIVLLAGAIRLRATELARSPAELLQRFDSNHDGRVTLYEYQRYLSRGFGHGPQPRWHRRCGRTTRGTRYPAPRTRPHHAGATLARQFHALDHDRNGSLDLKELNQPPQR